MVCIQLVVWPILEYLTPCPWTVHSCICQTVDKIRILVSLIVLNSVNIILSGDLLSQFGMIDSTKIGLAVNTEA